MGPDYDLVIAQDAVDCLSEPERIAVGYVATTVGSQCDWVSRPGAGGEGQSMQCKLTTALGLGDQCGARHKELMQRWLGDDLPDRCWKIPMTAYAQAVIDEVTIATSGTTITVAFKATGTTGPGGSAWSWSETLRFLDEGSTLDLVKHEVRGKPF